MTTQPAKSIPAITQVAAIMPHPHQATTKQSKAKKRQPLLIAALLLASTAMLPPLLPEFLSPIKLAAAQTPATSPATPAPPKPAPQPGSKIPSYQKTIVKIGILAKRGDDKVFEQWQATADYLGAEIIGHTFEIVPLDFEETYAAVEDGTVDFVIANSGMYVDFEGLYDANRIATLKNLRLGNPYTVFGGVLFRRADREDIQQIKDLKGKTMMAVNETSLGGWQMQWGEMKEAGIDPSQDLKELSFGDTHDNVVYAVQEGRVDVGAIRTDTLERMANEGKINLNDFVVINQQTDLQADFPFYGLAKGTAKICH